jgi:hypothetical protein
LKLAASDFSIWLIIAIIVGVAKMWNKFVTSQSDDSETAVPPARPRPQPRPIARPATSLPSRRQVERRVPPVARPVTETTWEVPPRDLREFMERLTQPPQAKPAPPTVAPPPLPKPAPLPPPPAPAAAKSVPPPPPRTSPWVEALRDQQNLRNIIIANEIIGRPRADARIGSGTLG